MNELSEQTQTTLEKKSLISPLWSKILSLSAVTIVLMILLSISESATSDRFNYQSQAVDSVSKNRSLPQTLVTPVLVIPYLEQKEVLS